MSAGYSGTPLVKKLGIKPGHVVALLGAPADLALDVGPEVTQRTSLRGARPLDVVLLFCRSEAELVRGFGRAQGRIAKDGGLWVCWPKKSSGVPTDLGDMVVREYGLGQGLVDNKVCAVDATWSALRFVWRREDR